MRLEQDSTPSRRQADGLFLLERLFHNAANSEQGGLLILRIIGHAGDIEQMTLATLQNA
jgi:hypothetical protein